MTYLEIVRGFAASYYSWLFIWTVDLLMGNWEHPLIELHAHCYNPQTSPYTKWMVNWRCRSLSQLNRYQQQEHSEEDNIGLDDIVIENGKIQHCNAEENCGGKSRLTSFLGGLFSYTRLAVVRRARNEGRICPSLIARGIVSGFRKIGRILRHCRRRHYSRRDTWREFW